MGQFNARILAEFEPPREWVLGRELSYTTQDLTADECRDLIAVGLKLSAVKRDTNKTETITVPVGFKTDLASTPRTLWAVIAPFDIARAAIIHDLLYKTIRQYRWGNDNVDMELVKKAKKAADKVFKLAMADSTPPAKKWKQWAAWKAIDMFGHSSIVPNKDNV